ncbi:hypothetical protein [Streptomyces sp. NBC_00102]|uniref:hypothetical protein n=1 Tax=Streptomyces sp. NBC_00102 TaxID=2975652 RepID=UPI00225B3640|nr:hypothetical protein [Streptomyces sp. NBC_00102]MCX5396564.1 hypothetical protein [Streptomyces sp. NBC_00102]
MSIERSDDDTASPSAPGRRRSSALVAAVAAAVVLAGGGSVWWVATADGPREETAATAAPSGSTAPEPAPLVVSGPADPSSPVPAPGGPAPTGAVYRAVGDLPEGPATARVRRAAATVPLSEAARLARAFGMEGTPTSQGGYWRLGAGGAKPYLEVSREGPGTWKYLRGTSPLSPCPSDSVCASGSSGGSPVSPAAARAAARPALGALGLGDASLTDGGPLGALRVVTADPVVDGLPTHGWSTDVQVGPDGAVSGASGRLLPTPPAVPAAAYPVVDARTALTSLNAARETEPACATAVPLDGTEGGAAKGGPQCVPSSGRIAPPRTMTVEKAVFGLSAQLVDERPALVPSWLFTVRPETGGAVSTVAQVAVSPAYLRAPSASRPARGVTPISYTERGRTLEVTFWGGVCGTYSAKAQESRTQVRVTITEPRPEPGTACVAVAKEQTLPVTLDAPLAGRTVVETASGRTVPRA